MKRILLVVAAIAAVATAAVWFAAEESYVTTVKTRVGTGLNVSTHGSQNYGLVFGQEERFGSMFIEINAKAKADTNLTGINYTIGCNNGPNIFAPVGNPQPQLVGSSICPNLTISPFGAQKLVVCDEPVPAPCLSSQQQLIQWTFVAPDCEGAAQKKDNPKVVNCSQDQNYALSGEVFVDVTGYQGSTKEFVCNKKTNTFFNGLNNTGIACTVGGDPQGPNQDELVDCDGIASRFSGCSAANVELKTGSPLTSWPTSPGFQGQEGIDIFDRDNSNSWTSGDDIHLEDEDGPCTTGNRGSGVHDFNDTFQDCLVLDLNNDLHSKDGLPVDCDLESGTFCTGTLVSDLKFFDSNGNGVYNNGEDIVRDFNGDGIFN